MNKLTRFTTPGGEEFVVLPRAEYELLLEQIEDRIDLEAASEAFAAADAGRDEGLTVEEVEALAASPAPLAFWLRKRGLTQKALAARVGLSQAFVSKLARGRATASVQTLRAVAGVLAVDLEDLLP